MHIYEELLCIIIIIIKNKCNIIDLVPWYIYCKSSPWSTANYIIISTSGEWKKLRMIISMYGEVQNTGNEPKANKKQNKHFFNLILTVNWFIL